MSVRFLVGRAGSGKTRLVTGAVREELLRDPAEGARLLLLVPEQASLQTEAALLAPGGPGALHRAEVLSFRRLARRVLSGSGAGPAEVLSSAARAMLLRHVVRRSAGDLEYYRGAERFPGFIESLARTIEELIEEAVEPDALEKASAAAPSLKKKIGDLARLYRAYLAALGPDRADPALLLDVARRRFADVPFLRGSRVWVDGFAGFTRSESLALADLAALADDVTIAILGDPSIDPAVEAKTPGALFRKTARTRLDLESAFRARGISIEEPVAVGPGERNRFSRSRDLARLERRLFVFPAPREEHVAAPSHVEILELPTRRLEADHVACRIADLVRSGLRYRDVAVVARDLEPYHDLLSAALSGRGIPHFVDRRRGIAHHPLVECVRSLARMAAERLSIDSVRLALKTDLLGLDREAADRLENALLAHGLEGPEAWSGSWAFESWDAFSSLGRERKPGGAGAPRADAAAIEAAREGFLRAVRPFLGAAGVYPAGGAPRPLTGRAWAEALRTTLEGLSVRDRLEGWAAEADAAGRTDEADSHRKIADDVFEFAGDLGTALSATPLRAEELPAIVDAGLSGLSLGLAPATVDQVLVGSVERSRHPELAVVFLVGFNDRVFPRATPEDAILSDEDRSALIAQGVKVDLPRRERAPEEALLAYIAVTRPSARLVVTYAAADERGKAIRPSPYVAALEAALPGLAAARAGDPLRERSTAHVRSAKDLAAALAFEMRSRAALTADPHPDRRAAWNALYEKARESADLARRLAPAVAALVFDNALPPLGAAARALLYGDEIAASVTRLETFAACPFRHFARHALELKPRHDAAARPEEIGGVHHKILELAIADGIARGRALSDLGPKELSSLVESATERVASGLPRTLFLAPPERAFLLERSRDDLRRVLEAQADAARAGSFRPLRTELSFGRGREGDLDALRVLMPDGREARLRGVIDRVDVAEAGGERLVVVVDYKRARNRRLALERVRHGLSLQLPLYLAVLRAGGAAAAGGPVRAAGAFFVSLSPAYESVDHPSDYDPEKARSKGPHRPRGIFADDAIPLLESAERGRLVHYSALLKADGRLGDVERSDAAPRAALERLLDEALKKAGALAHEIARGEVAVAPYRLRDESPCEHCEFRMACRFEFTQPGLRVLPPMKRSEVLGLSAEKDEKGEEEEEA